MCVKINTQPSLPSLDLDVKAWVLNNLFGAIEECLSALYVLINMKILGLIFYSTAAPCQLFVLKLALGEMGVALFPGQRVEPRVALEEGYSFRYPEFSDALGALLR